MKKTTYIFLLSLLLSCNQINDKNSLKDFRENVLINDEAEIAKEIFFHSYLLGFKMLDPNKKTDDKAPFFYVPTPILLNSFTTPPREDESLEKSINDVIKKETGGILDDKEREKIIKEILNRLRKAAPQKFEPIKVKLVDEKLIEKDKEFNGLLFFSLSNIGFSTDRKTAAVFIDSMLVSNASSGGEMIVVLRKEYEKWSIISFNQITVY